MNLQEAQEASGRHPAVLRIALQDGALHGTRNDEAGTWEIAPHCLNSWLEGMVCDCKHSTKDSKMNTHSTPLDSLKAATLRSNEQLDYVIDQLAGGEPEVPEYLLDILDGVKQMLLQAVGEHLPLMADPNFPESRQIFPPEAYVYDDGSPVVERFATDDGITSVYFPRYDGPREEAVQQHQEFVEQYRSHRKKEEEAIREEADALFDRLMPEYLDDHAKNLLSPKIFKDGKPLCVVAFLDHNHEERHISTIHVTVEQLEQPFHERHRFAYEQVANLLREHGHETYLAGFEAGLFSPVEGSQR